MKNVETLTRMTDLSKTIQSMLCSSFPELPVFHSLDADKAKGSFIAHDIPVASMRRSCCQLSIMVFSRNQDQGYDMAQRVIASLSSDLKEKNTFHGITPDYDPILDGYYHILDYDIALIN